MKKAFDQTMRDLKRGVNRKVLKVPSIEQKVLDSTSNEPWGPHGSLLADIALATRNFNEYKIIMAVIWKRINDTGKNWRHVYKALTVLEYLVAHGSERVIDEIREHAYQINTLSDFQYIDSSGRDQGSNVRKKSQCLVVLVNDKERMQEVRQKASANRDKFRGVSMGNVHRPSTYSSTGGYGEGRYSGHYGSRDDNRIGYGKERGWSHRDEDIYGDSYGRHGDRYDREYEERNSHYAYTDSDYRGSGTSKSIDEYSSRSRSFDREREIACDGSGQQSSRGSGAEDLPQNERQQLKRKFSEQNLAPLSLEEAAGAPTHTAGDVGTSTVTAESSSYQTNASPSQDTGAPENNEAVELREFDPHVSLSAVHCASSTSAGPEVDLLGSLFEPFSSNSLALVPAGSLTGISQDIKNPFGDEPFKAIPSSNGIPAQPPDSLPSSTQSCDVTPPASHIADQDIDILADILPPPRLSQSEQPLPPCQIAPHIGFPPQATQQASHIRFVSQNGSIAQQGAGFPSQSGRATFMTSFAAQPGQQLLQTTLQTSHVGSQMWFPAQTNQPQSLALVPSKAAPLTGFIGGYSNAPLCQLPRSICIQAGETTHDNNSMHFSSYHGALAQVPSQMGALQSPRTRTETIPPFAIQPLTQPAKEKFETKSTIWTDTLNRGLVNLNISGPKTNPLADIGVDFDAINRKEKRMAGPSNSTAPSVTMGKAMGCGSGIGRAGAGALRPLQTQMVSAHPAAAGNPLGGYGGLINQTMGIGMMRPLLPQQHIQQPNTGFAPGTNVTGGQYPLPGTTNYGHQPFGGGYHR